MWRGIRQGAATLAAVAVTLAAALHRTVRHRLGLPLGRPGRFVGRRGSREAPVLTQDQPSRAGGDDRVAVTGAAHRIQERHGATISARCAAARGTRSSTSVP